MSIWIGGEVMVGAPDHWVQIKPVTTSKSISKCLYMKSA
jgi:hypothetical protein